MTGNHFKGHVRRSLRCLLSGHRFGEPHQWDFDWWSGPLTAPRSDCLRPGCHDYELGLVKVRKPAA